MKSRLYVLVLCGGLVALCARGPAFAQDAGPAADKPELESTLAYELSQLAESWIHGDDAQAAARLDTFRNDNRMRGELPRWLAGMRAALALNAGDTKGAQKALQPILEQANNPRPYLRSAQLCLALDAQPLALSIIRQGRARDAKSPSMRRFEAGLLWLGNDHDAAIAAYIDMISDDGRENYPFVSPQWGDWRTVRPWGAGEKDAPPPNPQNRKFRGDWEDEEDTATGWSPEPFADLFEPFTWYATDLPGLERCIVEMAGNAELLARQRAAFTPALEAAHEAQTKLEAFRGGDAAQRKELARVAATTRWRAIVAARVCALADLSASKPAEAETMLRLALAVSADDSALLDLQARALGAQGKAEEARVGPLTKLAAQGLSLWSSMLYTRGPQQQAVDRVLDPALKLLRANPQAGKQQLEAARNTFGPEHAKRMVPQDLIGVWLLQHGEAELAKKYLIEAARGIGFESGKALAPDGVVLEHALLGLKVPAGAASAPPAGADGEGPEEEEEPAEPDVKPAEPGDAKPDPNAGDPTPLRVLPRAGLLLGSVPDSRSVIWRIAEVDFWGGNWGVANHVRAARALPDGDKNLRELLFGYHVRLSTELTPQQLDAALAPEHPGTVAMVEALKSFAEGLTQAKGGNNWRVMQSLRERSGFMLGMVETRALMLRARLRQEPPKTMAELSAWLKTRQALIDLRAQFKAGSSNENSKLAEERAAAKIPEVAHAGLLLDAAKVLARAGDFGGAAKLLWLNRDVPLGIDTHGRRLFLAALLARKAGDLLLEAQCRMAALEAADPRRDQTDNTLLLLEVPQLRGEIEEFGQKGDLEAYVESSIVPWADSASLANVLAVAPELRTARVTMLMRNSLRSGLDGIFRASLAEGSVVTISQNWLKMITPRESYAKCRRFALWVLCSDLPFMRGRTGISGLNTPTDTIRGWGMLHQLAESRATYDPAAKPEADRLKTLIARCSTSAEEGVEEEEEWWD